MQQQLAISVRTELLNGPFEYDTVNSFQKLLTGINHIHHRSRKNVPIVSIGSGLGHLEYLLKLLKPDLNIICVDPDPNGFRFDIPPTHPSRKFCIQPRYSYAKDLPVSLRGNCILLFIWPCPESFDEDNEKIEEKERIPGMEMRAISLLNPLGIFSNYAPCGASGSDALINAFAKTEFTTDKATYRTFYSQRLYLRTYRHIVYMMSDDPKVYSRLNCCVAFRNVFFMRGDFLDRNYKYPESDMDKEVFNCCEFGDHQIYSGQPTFLDRPLDISFWTFCVETYERSERRNR